jgi:hypothetical protein
MSDVGDLLIDAISVMDQRGWCQDSLENDQGAVCAIGAVNMVLYGSSRSAYPASTKGYYAFRALAAQIPDPWADVYDVIEYNNARGRTYQEIRDWFEKAALNEGVTL